MKNVFLFGFCLFLSLSVFATHDYLVDQKDDLNTIFTCTNIPNLLQTGAAHEVPDSSYENGKRIVFDNPYQVLQVVVRGDTMEAPEVEVGKYINDEILALTQNFVYFSNEEELSFIVLDSRRYDKITLAIDTFEIKDNFYSLDMTFKSTGESFYLHCYSPRENPFL